MSDRRKELLSAVMTSFRENDGQLSAAVKPLVNAIVELEDRLKIAEDLLCAKS